jgi:hypothetical protein
MLEEAEGDGRTSLATVRRGPGYCTTRERVRALLLHELASIQADAGRGASSIALMATSTYVVHGRGSCSAQVSSITDGIVATSTA